MSIKTIPLSRLEANLQATLNECADSGETIVVELPDQRLISIQTLQPDEDDSLMDRLIANNPDFRKLLADSNRSGREPFFASIPELDSSSASSNDQLSIERRFHDAMIETFEAAKCLKPPYYATDFLRMVNQYGGKGAADRLLASAQPSSGFTELFLRGKENLKLSVEYLVLSNPWKSLFNLEQLAVARKRLMDCQCELPPEGLS